ncbi:hypothetical protein JMN32_19065 [Fulvivirga sp. 29W222]|uniref:Helix-turn-helix type 11 domain-containing protein n=1 Tax=Fulvivirga marina TaxID=2494733 RepID=A0A937G0R9_9BACT|nr:hypothetical protein [Fulvivirga marina]MBL6448422.1 hypothetical protein [Fulvivirga marina]
MKGSKYLERIERTDRLIRKRRAGKAEDIAKRLGISKRSVFNMLRAMKEDFNAPIVFDRRLNTYRYTTEGSVVMTFVKDQDIKTLMSPCV